MTMTQRKNVCLTQMILNLHIPCVKPKSQLQAAITMRLLSHHHHKQHRHPESSPMLLHTKARHINRERYLKQHPNLTSQLCICLQCWPQAPVILQISLLILIPKTIYPACPYQASLHDPFPNEEHRSQDD